jgi:aryl-alcohol dehydrogenase-like predicted oxidoreductase
MSDHTNHATTAGTLRYAQRFGHLADDQFRQRYGLMVSSVGLGTYLGEGPGSTVQDYESSVQQAVERGCNVIDTAVNYRHMQSERDVGRALAALFAQGKARRDEVVVCTKGGFVPFDGTPPHDPAEDIRERFYATGITAPPELVGNIHCMSPDYLSDQIGVSLRNLGLEAIDVYYLHNPETQLHYVTPQEFRHRLRLAFARLEEEASAGRIRFYGVATWNGLLAPQTAQQYLPLSLLVQTAREVGGEKHRFRFLQFPYNLDTLTAVTDANQIFEGERNGQSEKLTLPLLAAARQHALVAIGSAGLRQRRVLGQISAELKEVLGGFETDAQYAIQFNRSTPGLTTTLVGMSNPAHVVENLAVTTRPGLSPENFFKLFAD